MIPLRKNLGKDLIGLILNRKQNSRIPQNFRITMIYLFQNISNYSYIIKYSAQSAGDIEYTDCISADW